MLFDSSDDLFDVLSYMEEMSSTKEKTQILADCFEDESFRNVIAHAVDPLRTYGVLKTPGITYGRTGHFTVDTWKILKDLQERRLTGHDARDTLIEEFRRLTPNSQELLRRIITKNLKIGVGAITVNKAAKLAGLPEPLVTTLAYMRCSLPKHVKTFDDWPWAEGVASEVKMDGMFASLSLPEGEPNRLLTRKGQEFGMEGRAWAALRRDLFTLPRGYRFEGELTVVKYGRALPRKIGNGLLNSLLSGHDALPDDCHIEYIVWDCVPLVDVAKRVYNVSRKERRRMVNKFIATVPETTIFPVETRIVHSLDEAKAHAAEIQAEGGEGTVFKHPEGIWKDGTSEYQIKLKCEHTADLRMLELVPGTEGKKNEHLFGSIRCGTDDELVFVDVSGFSDELRKDIFHNWSTVYEGRLMAVLFNEVINARSRETFSLYLPRFDEFRFDKDETDTYASISAML